MFFHNNQIYLYCLYQYVLVILLFFVILGGTVFGLFDFQNVLFKNIMMVVVSIVSSITITGYLMYTVFSKYIGNHGDHSMEDFEYFNVWILKHYNNKITFDDIANSIDKLSPEDKFYKKFKKHKHKDRFCADFDDVLLVSNLIRYVKTNEDIILFELL